MIAIELIRENPDLVRENIKRKFQDKKLPLVDEVIDKDKKLREMKKDGDDCRAKRNNLSSQIGMLMKEKKIEEEISNVSFKEIMFKKSTKNLLTLKTKKQNLKLKSKPQ